MQTLVSYAVLLAAMASTLTVCAFCQSPQVLSSPEQEVRRLSADEVNAFLHNDPAALERIWSDDFVVTNPLNRMATKKQVLNMVHSGFLVITSYDREIEYLHVYGNTTVIVAGPETVVWGGKMPNARRTEHLPLHGCLDATERSVAGGCAARKHYSATAAKSSSDWKLTV